MANITPSILIPIDTSFGSTAINYAPAPMVCPILALHCAAVSGTGSVKITPYRAADAIIEGSGSGGRLRLSCDSLGVINSVEIAAGGTGYGDGPVLTTIFDPWGTGGQLAVTASGGVITDASIVVPGSGYSGYIVMDLGDFVEGVTYDFIPRYIENSGPGTIKLFGYKLPYRPFQVF